MRWNFYLKFTIVCRKNVDIIWSFNWKW